MSWVPKTDFEEEIVDSQPYHNFIYGELSNPSAQIFYPRPKQHLDFVQQQKKEKNEQKSKLTTSQNHKLDLIAKIQRIAGTKPLGEQPTIEDWDTNENIVRETIALMRHVGINPSVEEALDEECTLATHPITDEVKINRNGRKEMPIFFGDQFFELKPRVRLSPSPTATSSAYASNNITEFGEENGFDKFDESIGSQRSSITSNGSNSISQGSSRGGQSRNSLSEFCKTTEFHKNDFHKTPQIGRTTHSSPIAKQSGRVSQSPKTKQSSRVQHSGTRTQYKTTQSDQKIPQSPQIALRLSRDSTSPTNSSSCSSNLSRGSNILTSSDTCKDRSSNTGNSGFESAKDEVCYEDSFETAHNSSTQRKNNSLEVKGKQSDNRDKVIKTQSWRNSNVQGQNNYHIQSNWRSPTEYRRKEHKAHKIKTELCTPKELYEKKRQSTQK